MVQISAAVQHTDAKPEGGRPLPSGVLAFLITDIEGSTQRWEAWPQAMRVAMGRHDHLVREALLRAGGHVFRTAGDAFYAAFVSPSEAIAAALAAQQALGREDFSEVGGIKVRMAVHAGPAESRDNDYFGQGMNRCARLLGIAYGGQVLISAAAADMASGGLPSQASLLDLGQHRLKDLAGAEQVYQLVAPGLGTRFPTLRSLDAKVNNLPRPVTSFVPRDTDVAEVKARLAKYRIVTLVGSGGAGKTRLALEVGSELLEDYPDGVWIAELAPLEDTRLVAETVCTTIGVPVQGSRSAIDSAIGYLRQKKALLILDNCEHLVEAAAHLAEELVRGCPSLFLLATSREPLGIGGESTYRVPSLTFPSRTEGITAAGARLRRRQAVRRARHRHGRRLLADRCQCPRGREHLQASRRHPDGDRARRSPAADDAGAGARDAPARPLPPARQGEPHGSPAPPDAADAVRLELQSPDRGGADAAAAAFGVRWRLDDRLGRVRDRRWAGGRRQRLRALVVPRRQVARGAGPLRRRASLQVPRDRSAICLPQAAGER